MNPDTLISLNQAVNGVLLEMSGESLAYDPNESKYRTCVYFINKALKLNALEHEWSYYSSVESIGLAHEGDQEFYLPPTLRPRLLGDDALQLRKDEQPVRWAFSLPRDALPKYAHRRGLWYTVTTTSVQLSRPISESEDGLEVAVPVMREPRLHRLPDLPTDGSTPPAVAQYLLDQPLDFDFPDIIVARACALYAASDPMYQPRVPQLDQYHTAMMYNLVERDSRHTDSPFSNEFAVPISSSPDDFSDWGDYRHPHADERGFSG